MRPTPYAGLVSRAIALAADALLINAIAALTAAVVGLVFSLFGLNKPGILAALTAGFLWLGWTGLYFIAFWSVTGETPGDRLIGIHVVPTAGPRIGIIRAALRFVVMVLALVPLGAGFVTVLFDDRRRGPHDMVARTVVRWISADAPLSPTAAVDPQAPSAAQPPALAVEAPPAAPGPSVF